MKNLLWCPIDLPKCPVIPDARPSNDWGYWKFTKLTKPAETPYSKSDWSNMMKEKHPELIEWFSLFPYKTVRNAKLNLQVAPVEAHIDFTRPELDMELWKNNNENEPCGYRILLTGCRQNKLYVIDNGKKIYCDMPDDTDTYVLGHTTTLHGVEQDENRYVIFVHFEIDTVRHQELLSRSLLKYSKHAIYKNNT